MIYTYRRNSLEPGGAVRVRSIESIGLEGMEGGRKRFAAGALEGPVERLRLLEKPAGGVAEAAIFDHALDH